MATAGRWILALLVVLIALGIPTAYYRSQYSNYKRYRVVTPGKFYRSGQFTANGLRTIIREAGIRSVINLQEENADPFMPEEWLGKPSIRESELCSELGVNYFALFGGEVVPAHEFAKGKRPAVIDEYLKILDNPDNYPVLLHCKAGLHRTGLMTAIYRMEYENVAPARAMNELRANGFGTFAATTANVYIAQYIEAYERGIRNGGSR